MKITSMFQENFMRYSDGVSDDVNNAKPVVDA